MYWNLGITKNRQIKPNTIRMPVTMQAEISPGFTSVKPKRLTLFCSCSTASRMTS